MWWYFNPHTCEAGWVYVFKASHKGSSRTARIHKETVLKKTIKKKKFKVWQGGSVGKRLGPCFLRTLVKEKGEKLQSCPLPASICAPWRSPHMRTHHYDKQTKIFACEFKVELMISTWRYKRKDNSVNDI